MEIKFLSQLEDPRSVESFLFSPNDLYFKEGKEKKKKTGEESKSIRKLIVCHNKELFFGFTFFTSLTILMCTI